MSKYENDRLRAMSRFVRSLLTEDYYRQNIVDLVAELQNEIVYDFGHLVFDKIKSTTDDASSNDFTFYDVNTEKKVRVSFNYVTGGKDEN